MLRFWLGQKINEYLFVSYELKVLNKSMNFAFMGLHDNSSTVFKKRPSSRRNILWF